MFFPVNRFMENLKNNLIPSLIQKNQNNEKKFLCLSA